MQRLIGLLVGSLFALAVSCGSTFPEMRGDLALTDALAQLETLPTPEGMSSESFGSLKDALAEALVSSGQTRFAASVPQGGSGAVTDLELRSIGGGDIELEWTYRNKGDYDQNSSVNISDLSALGANLGKTTSSPDWLSKATAADGDDNGEVNISDITPLGANLNATVSGYWIQTTMTPEVESSWENEVQVPFEDFAAPTGQAKKTRTFNLVDAFPQRWHRVVPYDNADPELGPPSNAVQYVLLAPDVTAVTPLSGEAGTAATFVATRIGGTPQTWAWDFGGGATPNTASTASPSVTLGSAGTYNASVTVTNGAGSDTFNFTLDVTNMPAPVVDDVQPQSGNEGGQVTLTATLSGGPPSTYDWSFGGGATPDTSTDISPLVTLGTAGPYNAALTVANAGGSDTFNFVLTVTPGINNPPTASFTATPQNGNPGDPVQLDANASSDSDGTIANYAWDLDGDGSYELDGGTDPLATTNLPNPAGSQIVGLRVTDNGGAQDTTTSTLSSGGGGSGWIISFVHGTSNGVVAPPYLAEVNGLPAIAFGELNLVGQMFTSFAYTDTDDGSNGWNTTTADSAGPLAMSLAEINGKPSIAFISDADTTLMYAYSSEPNGSSGWSSVSVDPTLNLGQSASLALINGKPAIAYHNPQDESLLYAHSAQDDGSADWSIVNVDGSNAQGGSLALTDKKPAIAYTTAGATGTELRFAYTSSDDGSSDWKTLTVPETTDAWSLKVSLADVNGFPSILWGSLLTKQIFFAHSTVANGDSNWASQETNMGASASSMGVQSLAFTNGFPYSALVSSTDQLNVGINGSPDGTAKWDETTVDSDTVTGVTLAIINGQPAVAYTVGVGVPEVRYAIYK